MPWISDGWRSTKWRGKGDLPAAEQAKLKRIVKSPQGWTKSPLGPHPTTPPLGPCAQAGVDFINTDRLKPSNFLRAISNPLSCSSMF